MEITFNKHLLSPYLKRFLALSLVFFLFAPTGPNGKQAFAEVPIPIETDMMMGQTESGFVIVGYRMGHITPRMGRDLTDLIYFSIQPTAEGDLDLGGVDPRDFANIPLLKQRYGTRVLITVGGWERSAGFAPMATHAPTRRAFIQNLTEFCKKYGFDGVDYDWEFPENDQEKSAYTDLIIETKHAFRMMDLMVTVALRATQDLEPDALHMVDRIHLMSYDHNERHATFNGAVGDVRFFVDQGVARHKIVLGVPFYGRNLYDRNQFQTYKQLRYAHHPPANLDEVVDIYFNNIGTIERKTRFAIEQGLGGMMIWEIGQDTQDHTSLIEAMYRILRNTGLKYRLAAPLYGSH